MSASDPGQELHEQLSRWVAVGLIDAGQACRIEAAEAGRGKPAADPGAARKRQHAASVSTGDRAGAADGAAAAARGAALSAPRQQRGQLVAEALGYLGAAIAIGAGAAVVEHFWHDVPAGAELGLAGGVAIALLTVGAALRIGDSAPLRRLRGVLWLVATVSTASFFAVLCGELLKLSPTTSALTTEACATALGLILWWRAGGALQHVAAFTGVTSLAATATYAVVPDTSEWMPGLAVLAVSALWAAAAWRGYLIPATTGGSSRQANTAGLALACIGLLTGARWVMTGPVTGQILAVCTVVALLTAGIAARRVLLLAFGAVGALIMLPQTADRYLPGSGLAALSACAVGLMLLGAALWLARSHRA